MLAIPPSTQAIVFINEVFINPPGPSEEGDANHEFIELLGTPGKKLDGYAIAVMNGTQNKLYPLESIPPVPAPAPEIDQFFSLDGFTLGDNGILVLTIRNPGMWYYPEILSDSHQVNWMTLWNGGLAQSSQLDNNGSFTIMIVRNRPGQTEADPCDPNGLFWGKEIPHDAELITPVDGNDQFGNGNLDRGDPNGMGGNTLEMTGLSTYGNLTDDLEIVDEVSFEDASGWEYDSDGRHVDANSTQAGLPHRHVHAIDDPAGFNPDALTRVDYRTKGQGWTPSTGGTGEMADGNNWQDTATEQWIRGNTEAGYTTEFGVVPVYFYENSANSDPNAVQPYKTHVPLWLDDGNSPDYDFTSLKTYLVAPGRINEFAIAFIPGDFDRDGVCDANDISKIAAVFGDDDWIFSNSFSDAPEGDSNDPATHTKPWDVDATGDNGIEANDMQWALNFQADTNGQIVGIRYDSTTPATSGVFLNPNTAIECNIVASVNVPSGRTLTTLHPNDIVYITVSGQVTAGPNTTSGHENGIMQYVHDLDINCPGVVKVISVEPLGNFNTTRVSLQSLQGTNGDLGIDLVNGYTTSFTEGLTGPNTLYRLTLQAVSEGSADVNISPAAAARFAASTPHGLKVGHTSSNGDPNSSIYPAELSITVVSACDLDGDGYVGWGDVDVMNENWLQQLISLDVNCLGHWKMNENASNTDVIDSSGNDYDGVFNDATGDPNTSAHHINGKISGAFTFDGVDDYVAIADDASLDIPGALSLAFWTKYASADSDWIISKGTTGSAYGYWAGVSAGKVRFGDNAGFKTTTSTFNNDDWHLVVCVYDGGSTFGALKIYVDNVEQATTEAGSFNGFSATNEPLVLGGQSDSGDVGRFFVGSIDNAMIFDKALTAEERSDLYNGGNGTEILNVGEIEGNFNNDDILNWLDFAIFGLDW